MSTHQPAPYGPPPQHSYPPPKRGRGKAIGAGAGVLALLGTVVGGYFYFQNGSDSSAPDDGKPHRLTAPETVVGGAYERNGNASSGSARDLEAAKKAGVRDAHQVGASYKSADASRRTLAFGGVYGELKDPEEVVDNMFTGLKEKQRKDPRYEDGMRSELAGSPQKFTPKGLNGAVLKCQEVKTVSKPGADVMTMPLCIWADHSTLGQLGLLDALGMVTGKGPTMDELAGIAAKVRTETRVAITK
ncbi:hypothetical protein I5Q34_02145 [Streptomyces sp. AV19]|uniref:hypothetical protein n=1 Tax=Streptomyces sp. AV19 TaxID=2793068 RepID=UPI0018FEDDDC|nr:hypothetical protein [Streptomyces sp. AV19]MBH1933101.1 hypothetical protein [Streptomyces sp. AV19]MDG4531814.1 hypothetical protein [Streptomyces sp. AV19]